MNAVIINFVESILLTWFLSSLLEFDAKKYHYQMVMIITNFTIITISNYIFIYDLLLTTNLIIINTLISKYFSSNDWAEIFFVICLENTFLNLANSLAIVINSKIVIFDAIVLSKVLYFVLGIFVIYYLKKKELYFNKKLYYLLSVVLFVLHFVISHLVIIYITFEYQYQDLIISFILFIVFTIGIFYILLQMSELYKSNLAYSKLKQKQENEVILKSLYNEIKIAKHDLKHVYQLLHLYMQQQSYEKINSLLENKLNTLDEIPTLINSKNELINIILNMKLIQAYTKGIHSQCEIAVTEKKVMNDYDLNELLSNLLENAVENCIPNGVISIQLLQDETTFSIKIENSITNKTDFKTKKDPRHHGFGIKSVKRIVERYHGNLSFDQSNEKFTVRVVLLV